MGNIKEINIKKHRYYFFNDIINIEDFASNLLKIEKKLYKNIDIYYIGYITKKDFSAYNNINSVNPSYFIFGEVDKYIREKNGNKYLIFASTDKNKKVPIKYAELWDEIKSLIDKIDGKSGEYGKDFTKIKFNSNGNLPLNKILKLHNLTIAGKKSQNICSLKCKR